MEQQIREGLQVHLLYNMDGRQWIENAVGVDFESKTFKWKLERGFVKIIPEDKLSEFVRSL